jgi:atlastin
MQESAQGDCNLAPSPREPRAVQIVEAKSDHSFVLNIDELKSLLDQPHIRNKKVCVVSVAGAFRKGKSFLLNVLLRYLMKCSNQQQNEWLGNKDELLTGFSWRGGSQRDTNGILLWNEPFLIDTPQGEVVVLLMDTQGSFDSQSTVRDCATIFALSTMISSCQVFNISQNIQEDDLQHLQLFTEYGRLALQSQQSKPFQRLMFLVRDWSFPYEYPYGCEGGKKKLGKVLQISENQHDELRNVRTHINSCFDEVDCFLLPHPGLKVATSPQFVGQLKDIDEEFQQQLKEFVPYLLSPGRLIAKSINGVEINAGDLVSYFQAYIKIYQGDDLPEPKTMLQATAEANNLAAVAAARDIYQHEMEQLVGGDKAFIKQDLLETHHNHISTKAIDKFQSIRKMGGSEYSEQYLSQLTDELEELYGNYIKQNESKNLFNTAKTPLSLFLMLLISYLCSGVAAMFGLYSIANMFNLLMGVVLVSLCTWSYARLTGEYSDISAMIDTLAEIAWDSFVSNLVKRVTNAQAAKAIKTD